MNFSLIIPLLLALTTTASNPPPRNHQPIHKRAQEPGQDALDNDHLNRRDTTGNFNLAQSVYCAPIQNYLPTAPDVVRHQIFEIKDASCGVKANACVFVAYDRDKPDIAAGGIELCNETAKDVDFPCNQLSNHIAEVLNTCTGVNMEDSGFVPRSVVLGQKFIPGGLNVVVRSCVPYTLMGTPSTGGSKQIPN